MYTYHKPTEELMTQLADNMRRADVAEVKASHGVTPREALEMGWNNSEFCVIVCYEGEALTIFGLNVVSIVSGKGIPWMLSSEKLMKHKKELLQISPKVVSEMMSKCSFLENHVHAKNKVSVRWLKWLGFTLEEPIVYGLEGDLFHRFYMGGY